MTFPKDFLWGAATSSYQIEGAGREEGRGECIWDRFCDTPGKVFGGHNGSVACDHYHRYPEDIALMKKMGFHMYRFSISWPRILPNGIGEINQKGIDFYDKLVDELLANEIRPFATLYHWDLPQALQDNGDGWENPEIVEWFNNYTDIMTKALGDRVKDWSTFNEPWVFTYLGNAIGLHAPGKTDLSAALRAAHHVLLSHGKAMPIIRENVNDAKPGIVITAAYKEPYSDSEADVKAAAVERATSHDWFLSPIFNGHYPELAIEAHGSALDGIDLDAVSAAQVPLDMLGLNYYTRHVTRAKDGDPTQPETVLTENIPKTFMDWEIYPEGLYNVLMEWHQNYDLPDLYITENGASFDDPEPVDGHVHDPDRVAYLESHFNAASRAIDEGVPLRGYFVWSLLDNFEWAYGYDKRFGIIHVDFETQKRTLKDSALFYRDWIVKSVQPV